jgi:hypothetical protein
MQDKAKIETMAARKSGGSPALLLAWKGALESLPALPGDSLELVTEAVPSPDTLRQLGRFLAREPEPGTGLKAFLKEVDDSPESLAEWLKAFEVFAIFLESTPHRPSLSQATGYLHCCVSMARTGSSYGTFPLAVETMLETYGYAGESA